MDELMDYASKLASIVSPRSATAYVLEGYPGCGKSTLAEFFSKMNSWLYLRIPPRKVSLNYLSYICSKLGELPRERSVGSMVSSIARKHDIVLDECHLRNWNYVKEWINAATHAGASVLAVNRSGVVRGEIRIFFRYDEDTFVKILRNYLDDREIEKAMAFYPSIDVALMWPNMKPSLESSFRRMKRDELSIVVLAERLSPVSEATLFSNYRKLPWASSKSTFYEKVNRLIRRGILWATIPALHRVIDRVLGGDIAVRVFEERFGEL
ncbi:MAG: hypothetical protein QXP84_05245 [Candidatus Korarchaeum sp.]